MKIFTTGPADTRDLAAALDKDGFANRPHIRGNGGQCWIEVAKREAHGMVFERLIRRHKGKIVLIS